MDVFQSWLGEYLAIKGLDAADAASLSDGLSVEQDDGTAFALTVCGVGEQVLFMAPLAALDPDWEGHADFLLALHRLNEESRWRHDWTVTMDATNVLALSCVRCIADLRPATVDDWIDEGMRRHAETMRLLGDVLPTLEHLNR